MVKAGDGQVCLVKHWKSGQRSMVSRGVHTPDTRTGGVVDGGERSDDFRVWIVRSATAFSRSLMIYWSIEGGRKTRRTGLEVGLVQHSLDLRLRRSHPTDSGSG
jgi:hypothetical protein